MSIIEKRKRKRSHYYREEQELTCGKKTKRRGLGDDVISFTRPYRATLFTPKCDDDDGLSFKSTLGSRLYHRAEEESAPNIKNVVTPPLPQRKSRVSSAKRRKTIGSKTGGLLANLFDEPTTEKLAAPWKTTTPKKKTTSRTRKVEESSRSTHTHGANDFNDDVPSHDGDFDMPWDDEDDELRRAASRQKKFTSRRDAYKTDKRKEAQSARTPNESRHVAGRVDSPLLQNWELKTQRRNDARRTVPKKKLSTTKQARHSCEARERKQAQPERMHDCSETQHSSGALDSSKPRGTTATQREDGTRRSTRKRKTAKAEIRNDDSWEPEDDADTHDKPLMKPREAQAKQRNPYKSKPPKTTTRPHDTGRGRDIGGALDSPLVKPGMTKSSQPSYDLRRKTAKMLTAKTTACQRDLFAARRTECAQSKRRDADNDDADESQHVDEHERVAKRKTIKTTQRKRHLSMPTQKSASMVRKPGKEQELPAGTGEDDDADEAQDVGNVLDEPLTKFRVSKPTTQRRGKNGRILPKQFAAIATQHRRGVLEAKETEQAESARADDHVYDSQDAGLLDGPFMKPRSFKATHRRKNKVKIRKPKATRKGHCEDIDATPVIPTDDNISLLTIFDCDSSVGASPRVTPRRRRCSSPAMSTLSCTDTESSFISVLVGHHEKKRTSRTSPRKKLPSIVAVTPSPPSKRVSSSASSCSGSSLLNLFRAEETPSLKVQSSRTKRIKNTKFPLENCVPVKLRTSATGNKMQAGIFTQCTRHTAPTNAHQYRILHNVRERLRNCTLDPDYYQRLPSGTTADLATLQAARRERCRLEMKLAEMKRRRQVEQGCHPALGRLIRANDKLKEADVINLRPATVEEFLTELRSASDNNDKSSDDDSSDDE